MVLVDGVDDTWKVATATLPGPITVESMPQIKHVAPEQDANLVAAVPVGPTTTLTPVISDV